MNINQKYIVNPFIQAVIVFLLYVVAATVSKSIGTEPKLAWTLAIAVQLLYIIYNIIIGLINPSRKLYWAHSLMAFMGLVLINSFFAKLFSGLSMDEAGTYRWLYFVFFPVYLLFILMTTAIRKIVSLAEKDDRKFDA